jgi:hypothetical protein
VPQEQPLAASFPSAEAIASAAVVAFDPGRRIGVAWVDAHGRRLHGTIIEVAELDAVAVPATARVVVGDGTGCRALAAELSARGWQAERIDEVGTSERARALYWRDHGARGVGRLVPLGMRSPPRPIDDYAAYAIALRALSLAPDEPRRARAHRR